MTLSDVIERLDEFDDELTIYAERAPDFAPSSRAVVARDPADGSLPPAAAGLDYFLEIDTAKEAIEVWSEWRDGAEPTRADRFGAVWYYAVNDAYLPADDESG